MVLGSILMAFSFHVWSAWIPAHIINGRYPTRHKDRIPSPVDTGARLFFDRLPRIQIPNHAVAQESEGKAQADKREQGYPKVQMIGNNT